MANSRNCDTRLIIRLPEAMAPLRPRGPDVWNGEVLLELEAVYEVWLVGKGIVSGLSAREMGVKWVHDLQECGSGGVDIDRDM